MRKCSRASTLRSRFCPQRRSCVPAVQAQKEAKHVLSRREHTLGLCVGVSLVSPLPSLAATLSDEAYTKADAIKRIVRLFINRNFGKLASLTAPDAFVFVQGPPELPYSGRYQGVDCVEQFMNQFNESFVILSIPEVYYYLNESGSVFVGFDFELQAVKNPDIKFNSSFAMKFKVNEDLKLTKVAIISDTLRAYQSVL